MTSNQTTGLPACSPSRMRPDQRPIVWSSGSLNNPTCPPGTSSGPMIFEPPSDSAFSSAAPTSSTPT
jgi:hypothetical protein